MTRGRIETTAQTHLAPHPWDQFGPPPPLGGNYPASRSFDTAIHRIDGLLAEARVHLTEAEEKDREAREEEDAANDCYAEAQEIVADEIEKFDSTYAGLIYKQIQARAAKINA